MQSPVSPDSVLPILKIVLVIIQGSIAYTLAKYLGPLFPLLIGGWWALSEPENRTLAFKVCGGASAVELLLSIFMGWQGVWPLNLVSAIALLIIPDRVSGRILRGTSLNTAKGLKRQLAIKEAKYLKKIGQPKPISPQLEIGGIKLPNYLENLGFFFVGSPGSGKTQAIIQLLAAIRQREDFRVICLDRDGELLEQFYNEARGDIIFNPRDSRSISWSHTSEKVSTETIAAALVPDNIKEPFFSDGAKALISDIYERTFNNAEVWEVLSKLSMSDFKDFLSGTTSARYFEGQSGNTGASVMSTLVNSSRFYKLLATLDKPENENFSFSNWGRNNDPRWIFLPIFEEDSELFKPLYSAAFELMLRGLLSNKNRNIKTALIIDELGALNQLRSLNRLLSESRKFGGTAFLGTQTDAQLLKTYGPEDTRIILQGTATKLILNCRDPETAERFSKQIGIQERIDVTRGTTETPGQSKSRSRTEQIRETSAVLTSELQNLEPLEGYLTISDGTLPAKVRVTPVSQPKQAERFIERNSHE